MKNTAILLLLPFMLIGSVFAVWDPDSTVSLVTIQISDGDDVGQFEYLFQHGKAQEKYNWLLADPLEIHGKAKGNVLATISSLDLTFIADPSVDLNFSVQAGSSDTTFTITSALLSFDALNNPYAYASAAVTLTDLKNDGATLTGLIGDGKLYQASANEIPWALLVDSFTAGIADSEIGKGRQPATAPDWDTIPGAVTSMQSQFNFKLSAYDSASGTSHFEVVPIPEPASLALLGIGSVILLRRKK